MKLYNTRAFEFFLQSIVFLKKESGGQRWNEICEDGATLFETNFPKEAGPQPFSHAEIWELLFDPPQESSKPLYKTFETLCENDLFVSFFFKILQALLDPPSLWWRENI